MEREKLFFKNVILHKSMSYKLKIERDEIDRQRKKFQEELIQRQRKKDELVRKNKSLYNIIKNILYDC